MKEQPQASSHKPRAGRTRFSLAAWGLSLAVALAGCSTLGGGDSQTGKASWYGSPHHGKKTASGERFDQHAMTAAHRTLPFGTRVRVTNLDNGREVTVRINDRGPFKRGRVIDLSRAAAQRLDMLRAGIAPVRIQPLKP
ncbi:septal ring lytic transglycosylase RlpA family protein [Stutzerimonas kirkiae]|uniref:Endolytic peptidoglycan transglycosylase RlpA n=1 Tax=Stutzerimonas kirkiae TaxID=2211392 RepID=A0A4V2KD76_9GAMM|nr:septal ring lytic transglycosylase RlpA family protein [Stutzerimonas kirkiae]TBU97895.1 septal ring lytic transglycosylase RlpA family lipoprotein [Stutzerimonas kirkiae]TBV04589.1 septal ring lytic transglycosylase RlpA family lipoprotein [Stutzerimonas kirkiae]TBV11624.1 septal ring lytic transglycosylase RlpA family lipoprotein [Stutzerimonas kirkiae]TBV16073.1 septal ring lytic transglycosylase RlpA family lipoprotein [Stutzerimonas kirkiae]